MSSGTSRQIGKIVAKAEALGATVSKGSLKLVNPLKSIDLNIVYNHTHGITAPTLTALATNAGMLAAVVSVEVTGSNGYSQVFGREALLGLSLQVKGPTVVDAIDLTTSATLADQLLLRLPLGLTTLYESLTISITLSAAAILYSADPPSAENMDVQVAFNEGFVANEYRTYKKTIPAEVQTTISDLPTVGNLENIVVIQDIDTETDKSDFMVSVNNLRISQDTSLVTGPESYQLLNNFKERNKNLEDITSTLRGKIGMVPMKSLVLTNTEEVEMNQNATTDTFDLILIIARSRISPNESPTTPYLSDPTALVEESVAEPPSSEVIDDGVGGQFSIGGGGVGVSLPILEFEGRKTRLEQLRPAP